MPDPNQRYMTPKIVAFSLLQWSHTAISTLQTKQVHLQNYVFRSPQPKEMMRRT